MTRVTKHIRHAAHKAGTARAHHKVKRLHKADKFDALLSPQFAENNRSTRQEVIAGVIAGGLLLIFVLALLVLGPSSLGSLSGKSPKPVVTVSAPKPIIANQQFLQLTLDNWTYSGGGPQFRAYAGFRFVVVNVAIAHKYAVPTWLAPSLQSYVQDGAGQQYQLTPDDEIKQPLVAKEYKPGEVATGELAYEVPGSAKQLAWCYDLGRGTDKTAPLCIDLR